MSTIWKIIFVVAAVCYACWLIYEAKNAPTVDEKEIQYKKWKDKVFGENKEDEKTNS